MSTEHIPGSNHYYHHTSDLLGTSVPALNNFFSAPSCRHFFPLRASTPLAAVKGDMIQDAQINSTQRRAAGLTCPLPSPLISTANASQQHKPAVDIFCLLSFCLALIVVLLCVCVCVCMRGEVGLLAWGGGVLKQPPASYWLTNVHWQVPRIPMSCRVH